MVQLKENRHTVSTIHKRKFQFQYGTIKRKICRACAGLNQNFNSNMVQLKATMYF